MMAPYECYKQGTLHNLFTCANCFVEQQLRELDYTCQVEYCNIIKQREKVPDHTVGVLLFAPQAFTENLDVILIELCFI